MSQLSSAARMTASDADDAANTLFKDDRPKRIDKFIDYFGTTDTAPAGDACGERLFEELGSDDE